MKNTGRCPKCESTDMLNTSGTFGFKDQQNFIKTGLAMFSAVQVTRYLCVACGFSEEWVESKEERLKLKKELAL